MEQGYLIDTNVIIDFSENKLPAKAKQFIASIIDTDPYFSVINKIELLGFYVVNDLNVNCRILYQEKQTPARNSRCN